MDITSALKSVITLKNCINAQERDFPNISRSDACRLGKLLYLSFMGHDTEKNMKKYRVLRAAQERKWRQNGGKKIKP